jgi:hypothetical protein
MRARPVQGVPDDECDTCPIGRGSPSNMYGYGSNAYYWTFPLGSGRRSTMIQRSEISRVLVLGFPQFRPLSSGWSTVASGVALGLSLRSLVHFQA